MAFINSCTEQDSLGEDTYRAAIAIKPVAYLDGGVLKRNQLTYEQKGAPARPYVLDRAPLVTELAIDGGARFCPVRSDLSAYVQFGAPLLKTVDRFEPIASLSAASLSKAQSVSWDSTNFSMEWLHAGHYGSWLMRPRKGWKLPAAISFPFTVAGLTRKGDTFLRDGKPVCFLRNPTAHDLTNPENVVALPYEWLADRLVIDTSKMPDGEWEIDPTLFLQPGPADGKDTHIYSILGATYNYGVSATLIMSIITEPHILLEFDCSSIPAAAKCSSSSVSLKQAYKTTAVAWTMYWYSLAAANAAWIEGTQNGTLALAGEPCWNALAANGAGGVTTAWAGGAGCKVSGTDYEAALLGSISGNRSDNNGTEYAAALTPSRVQDWFGVTNRNYGITQSCSIGNWMTMASSDHATAAFRPMLTVIYSLPAGLRIFSAPFVSTFGGPFA